MIGLFACLLERKKRRAKANDTDNSMYVHMRKTIMVGKFTYSGFLIYTRAENGLSFAKHNTHPPFKFIPDLNLWACPGIILALQMNLD